MAHAFAPSSIKAEAGKSLSVRLAWATDLVAGLHRETLPPPNETNKNEVSKKDLRKLF